MRQTLRPYQQACIDDLRRALSRGVKRAVLHLPTGAGKTTVAAGIVESASLLGNGVWFVAHRRELVLQAATRLRGQGLDVGVVMAGHKLEPEHAVQVLSVDTYNARMRRGAELPSSPSVIIPDEAHHAPSSKWDALFALDAIFVGLTATPYRGDGVGLSSRFDVIVAGPTPVQLRDLGHLTDAEIFCGPVPNLEAIHTRAGDYVRSELADACDGLVADVAQTYAKLAGGKRAICFAVNRAHSEHLVARFQAEGFRAAHIDFATPDEERKRIISAFAAGEVDILCNVEIVTEGFDVPECEVVILARPTKSEGLYVQMVGRALRPAPGKAHAIVLDHGYNVVRHGHPLDTRAANMDGRKADKRSEDAVLREAGPRICSTCLFLNGPGSTECRCGATLAPPPPLVDANVELTRMKLQPANDIQLERRQRHSHDQRRAEWKRLEAMGRKSGHKPWWSSYRYRAAYGVMPHDDGVLTGPEIGRYWKARRG